MTTTDPSLDAVFELLAARRRRYLLYYLEDEDAEPVVELDDLADRISAWEEEWTDEDAVETDSPDAIRDDLHHVHLPRLADAGLVEYDARTRTVRNRETPNVEQWVRNEKQELRRLRDLFRADEPSEKD